jgi:hypothetical protein
MTALVGAFILTLLVPPASAQERVENPRIFGLGAVVGEPTGVTAKLWVADSAAVDMGIGWSFSGKDSVTLYGDYLFHLFDVFQVPRGKLPLYFGIGGRVRFEDDEDDEVGARFPVGVSYFFDNMPVELFGEVVPILDVVPDTNADLNLGVGARYYF